MTVEVNVPADAAAGSYPMQVTAADGAGQSTLTLAVAVQAEVDSGVGVKADFPSLRADPGTPFDYTLTVTNNTPESQTFTFAAQGPQGWTVTASPNAAANANTVTVDADGTTQVKVTATPPDTVNAGQYPIAVTITSDSGATGQMQLTAEVTGSSKLGISTADQRLNVSGKANSEKRVTLVVANTGTAAVDAVQFAATPPSGWTVTFDPPKVDKVKPNETTQVVAVVRPSKNALAGDYAIGLQGGAPGAMFDSERTDHGDPRGSVEVAANARRQYGQRERLGDVVVGPGLESVDHVEFGAPPGDHDDRSLGMASTQLPAQLDTVTIWKAEIDESDVVVIDVQRLAARRDSHGLVTPRQAAFECLAHPIFVLDDTLGRVLDIGNSLPHWEALSSAADGSNAPQGRAGLQPQLADRRYRRRCVLPSHAVDVRSG